MFYNPVHYMRHPKPYVRRQIEKASKDPRAVSGIGTSLRGLSFYDLFPRILNGEIALVMKPNPERGGQPIKDEEETQKARAVQIAIQDKFKEWIKEHPDKATAVEQAYNREVNNTVEWKPNGRHLKLYGKAASVGLWPDPKTGEILPLRGHQLDAIWRWMMKGNTYYAHDMGTGKTFSLVATAMEARRLGLRKRPMLVVKLATLNQIERDFKRLYPTARVLVLHVTSNQDENRRQMAKIVSQDWDCIIVPDSQYNKITLSPERQHLMLKEDLKQFEEYLEASRAAEESEEFGARAKKKQKDLAKQIRALEDRIRLKQLAVQARAYGFLDFDEMGVDMILVDEAHTYKNIPFETKYDERGYHLQGISGGGPEEGQNAQNYYWKMRYMNDAHPGGIVLSSGTPITNSISELFNIQRVLEPEVLTETGSLMFDGWVANYGRIEDDTEVSETGQSYRNVTRFTKFVNTGQLMRQVYNVMELYILFSKIRIVLDVD